MPGRFLRFFCGLFVKREKGKSRPMRRAKSRTRTIIICRRTSWRSTASNWRAEVWPCLHLLEMGIKLWSNSRGKSVRLGDCNSGSKWRLLWRKIKQENKKIFHNSTPPSRLASYDMDSYSQNFDQGPGWTDPENRFRSFSARFAVPSKILQDNDLMDRCWYIMVYLFSLLYCYEILLLLHTLLPTFELSLLLFKPSC